MVPRTIYLLPNIEYLAASSMNAGHDALAVTLPLNRSPNKEGSKNAERFVRGIFTLRAVFCSYLPECVEGVFSEVQMHDPGYLDCKEPGETAKHTFLA